MNSRKLFVQHFITKFKFERKDLHIIDMLSHYSLPIQKIRNYITIKDELFIKRIDAIMKALKLDDLDQLTSTVIDEKFNILMSSNPTPAPLKLIILDDEPGTPQLISRAFNRHKWEAHCFSEPDKTLIELVDSESIDLIISDIRMPHYDGVEFTKSIRAAKLDQPTIILITAGSKYTQEEIMEAGANTLIPKPFHNDTLFEKAMKTIAINQTFFRPRELRMKAELNIVLDGITITKTADINTQGMFITLDDLTKIRIGNVVKFDLTLPGVGVISGSCLAKWVRLTDEPSMPTGLGTSFQNLSIENKSLIANYIEHN
jgi:CheY-like chemotaxis protein